ncbi:MAG TPA: benzoate-CoA ligase family protein, partial [Blastocatellia bacterium]|nr:benzoate-CoA ligase family protein [Blastocatellia bacterium]
MNLVEFIFGESKASASDSKTAICFDREEISYERLYGLVRRAAGLFRSVGIESGQRLAIIAADGPHFVVAFLGSIAVGAVAVPLNTMLPVDVLRSILDNCGPRGLVADQEQFQRLDKSGAIPGTLRNVWITRPAPDELKHRDYDGYQLKVESFGSSVELAPESNIVPAADDSLAFILYTSGSSGAPKGVMHLHRGIPFMVNAACRQVLGIVAPDRLFSSSRMFFAYGLGNGLYFPLSIGATSILSDSKPTPAAIAEVFARYRPTVFFGVPAVYKSLCQFASAGNQIDTRSLRFCVSAGERLPESLYAEWKRLTGLDIIDHIGATEMLQMFISNRPNCIKPGSAGTPVPGCEVKLVDESGKEIIGPGLGEIAARSGSAFSGYFNDPEQTARAIRDGWVYTRDMFRRDAEGCYWFEGRADDLFKVKGQWVSPVEVEDALLDCPEVHEAAVIAAVDEAGLGRAMAWIVPSAGNDPGPAL